MECSEECSSGEFSSGECSREECSREECSKEECREGNVVGGKVLCVWGFFMLNFDIDDDICNVQTY